MIQLDRKNTKSVLWGALVMAAVLAPISVYAPVDEDHHYLAGEPVLNWRTGEILVNFDLVLENSLDLRYVYVWENNFSDKITLIGAAQEKTGPQAITLTLTEQQINSLAAMTRVGKLALQECAYVSPDGIWCNRHVTYSIHESTPHPGPPDTTPPSISVVSSHNSADTSTTIKLSASATDNVGVTSITWYDGQTVLGTGNTISVTLSAGQHTITARAADAVGNVATSTPLTLVISKPAPKYDVSCTDGTQQIQGVKATNIGQDSIGISWTALNCPGDYVIRYWQSSDRTNTFKTAVVSDSSSTLTGLEAGTKYTFRVLYNEPNPIISPKPWKASSPLEVTTLTPPDTTPPSISVVSSHKSAYTSTTIKLSASATDNVGVTSITWYDGQTVLGTGSTISVSFSAGQHIITAKAADASDNVATSTPLTLVISAPDTTPPSISVVSSHNSADTTTTIKLSASATDNVGVTSITWYDGQTVLGTGNTISVSFSVGQHTITARAADAYGNVATSSPLTLVISAPVPKAVKNEDVNPSPQDTPPSDTTPPSISVVSSHNSADTTTTIKLSASATDNVGVTSITWYDGQTVLGTGSTISVTLSVGQHTITARAADAYGNVATSTPLTLVISKPAPKYDVSCTDGTQQIQGVKATSVNQDSIGISWTALNCPGDYVVRYWQTDDRARTVTQGVISAGYSSFTATGLEANTQYTFRVLYDEPDDSITPALWKASKPLRATTLTSDTPPIISTPQPSSTPTTQPEPSFVSVSEPKPAPPPLACEVTEESKFGIVDVSADAVSHDAIRLSWQSTNCSGDYMVRYWESGNPKPAFNATHTDQSTFNVTHTEHDTCTIINDLTPNTEYTYDIRYVDTANSTNFERVKSTPLQVHTMALPSMVESSNITSGVLKFDGVKPTVTDQDLQLSWMTHNCPGRYTVLYWETDDLFETFQIANVPTGQSALTITDLAPNTTHTIRVVYEGPDGNTQPEMSHQSRSYPITTLPPGQTHSKYDATCIHNAYKIGDLDADVSAESVQISWQPLNCQGDYVVRYWELAHKARSFQQVIVPAGHTTYTATGLEPDTQYVFRVMYYHPDNKPLIGKSSPLYYLTTEPAS